MKTMTEESLQRKLARLESALDTERARLRKACDKIPWEPGCGVPNVPRHSEERMN